MKPVSYSTPQTRLHALSVKSRMVAAFPFTEFEFPAQRILTASPLDGARFPLALKSDREDVSSLDDFVAKIQDLAARDEIVPLLNRNGGAILFRDTHAETPDDFSRVAHAFNIGTHHEEVRRNVSCVV